jgi:hypothetical protein
VGKVCSRILGNGLLETVANHSDDLHLLGQARKSRPHWQTFDRQEVGLETAEENC